MTTDDQKLIKMAQETDAGVLEDFFSKPANAFKTTSTDFPVLFLAAHFDNEDFLVAMVYSVAEESIDKLRDIMWQEYKRFTFLHFAIFAQSLRFLKAVAFLSRQFDFGLSDLKNVPSGLSSAISVTGGLLKEGDAVYDVVVGGPLDGWWSCHRENARESARESLARANDLIAKTLGITIAPTRAQENAEPVHVQVAVEAPREPARAQENAEPMQAAIKAPHEEVALLANAAGEDAEAKDEDAACVICMHNAKRVVLLPCGHLCLCIGCTRQLKNRECPMCRNLVASAVVTF